MKQQKIGEMSSSKYFKSADRMATRKSPQHEESSAGEPPASLDSLFTEIAKMSTTLSSVATDVSAIKETTTELKTTVQAMQERLSEAETRITRLEETTEQTLADKDKKSKLMEAMWERVQAMENNSKRNNVRLVGLKETFGTNGTLLSCVQKILEEGLGIRADAAEFEMERAHRTLTPVPDPERPPRPVLIRFLRQSARDKVINVVKEKRGFVWEGCRLSVFPDMTKELAEKRKSFTPVKRKLQEMEVKYTLAYPATLRFKWQGKNVSFTTATAADKFISNNNQDGD